MMDSDYDTSHVSYAHHNFQEQLREKLDMPHQHVPSIYQLRRSTLKKLDRYTFKKFRNGPMTCSSKSVYSLKDDILSEEQDGDDEDSIHHEDAIMDEQQDEDEEISSQRSGTTTVVEIEEEKFTDIQGENDIPSCYYCNQCRQTHFTKCYDTASAEGCN